MFFLGSILALILGTMTIGLQVYSFKTRNPFFAKASKRLLILSLAVVLAPSLLLCYIQEDYGKWVVIAEKAKREKELEESKFISEITIRWKAGVATDESQIRLISSITDQRLKRADRKNLQVKGAFDHDSAYTNIKSLDPQGFDSSKLYTIITEAVTPTLNLRPSHPYTSFPATESYDEMISVRSVHPAQERMALSGYPDAPEGYIRMPWKDGFIYVSDSYHINDQYIYNAEPYLKNDILLTLTPEGLARMNAMAVSLSQLQIQVALIYKGKVRGVYEPQICVTDQLVVSDIPETPQQIELEADALSQPKGFVDVDSTQFGYAYPDIPEDKSFIVSAYQWLCSENVNKLWIMVYAVLLLAVSLFLTYLHFKTRPTGLKNKF